MYEAGQSDKRGESWLGWLKSQCTNPWGERKILDWSKGLSPLSLAHCLLIACPFLWKLNASKPALLRARTRYKRGISLGVKTITPFWSHRFQGYWGSSNFSTLALQICPPVTIHRAAGLHDGPGSLTFTQLFDLGAHHPLSLYWLDSISLNLILYPACFRQCCYGKREQLLNWLGPPLKWL